MASKNNSEEPFTDGAYSYPMECLRSLVGGVSPETRRDRRYLPAVLEDGQGYTESTSMAQSPSVAGFVQQSHQVVQQKPDETAPLKRQKKEPGAPTKKSVVVLKGSDVTKRDGLVFMPNTIEMANLKKTEKGQFKKMQMSSKMSFTEIGQTLTALFPNLKNKRFYCASAADNRTRLDFHGEPRIWDGRFMKQTIKGNSALYIFVDEPPVTSVEETQMEVDQNQEESTTSGKQSVGNRSLQINGGNVQATDTSCPPLPHSYQHAQGMVSSTLAPQMSSLNISSAAFVQERDQSVYPTLPGRQFFARLPFEQNTSPGQGNVASTEMQVVAVHSPVQPKQTIDVNAKVMNWVGEIEEACLSGLQENWGESGSDYESQLTDSAADWPTDSGIEASDVFCISDDVFEDKQHLPSCVTDPPPSSQMNDKGKPDAAMEGNSFDGASYDMTALVGVVQGIFPTSGSLKGGVPFQISLKEELPDEVHQATVLFEGVAGVRGFKANPFNLQGFVPPSPVAGPVLVSVTTDAGEQLGITCFEYIDEVRLMAKQFVNNPTLQGEWFFILSQELGFLPNRSDVAHALGPLKEVSNEDSSVKEREQKSIQFLQQMVYLAAQAGAQHFIEIVFGTSAGQIVYKSYKDRTPLPEDVARANGHKELAQYLQDINKSLSREEDVQSFAIDWSELIMAIQKKSAVKQVEPTLGLEQSSEDDDHASDYFADAESCSCGSSDCDTDWSDTVENIVSDSKEFLVREREPTQEQIVIEHVPAVSKSVALNKGEERESSEVQTPQRLSNSTRLRGVSIEGTGKGNCHGGERFYPVQPVYIPWIRRDDTGQRVTGLRSLESMVVSISNELTTDDFVKMKFLLEDHLPRWEIENAVRPYELFCLMIKYGILSSTYLNRVMELLRLATRPDLLPIVTPLVMKDYLEKPLRSDYEAQTFRLVRTTMVIRDSLVNNFAATFIKQQSKVNDTSLLDSAFEEFFLMFDVDTSMLRGVEDFLPSCWPKFEVRDGKQSQPSPLHTTELKEFFSHVFKLETTHRTKAKQLLNHQEFATDLTEIHIKNSHGDLLCATRERFAAAYGSLGKEHHDNGSFRKQDSSTRSKQSILRRSHDQMTSTMKNGFRINNKDVTIMAQGGILAQLGMTQNIVSTVSESQTRAPVMHIADGYAETRNTIPSESSLLPHADLQGILSSSLTPHLNSLSIASAASEQERCQLWQTTANLSHILLEARVRREQGIDTATVVQGITCNCTDQSKRGYVWYAEVQCAGKRGSVSNATDAHQEDSGSDFESPSSDSAVERPSGGDSGIEGSDNLLVDDKSSGTGFEPVLAGISVPGNLENTLCLKILEPDDQKDLSVDGGPSIASMVEDALLLTRVSEELLFMKKHAKKPDVDTSMSGGIWCFIPTPKMIVLDFGTSVSPLKFGKESNLMRMIRRAMDLRLKREESFFHRRLLMKEQHLLEREQLFGMQRLLAQKLSTKTELLLSVRLLKRERKFQGTYELSGDPLCKSVNSYEGEPKEVALAKLRELLLDTVRAARKFRENNLRVHNSRISELQQAETNACKELTLCILRRGAPTTYEEVQTSLHVNDVQLEDLAVEFCGVF